MRSMARTLAVLKPRRGSPAASAPLISRDRDPPLSGERRANRDAAELEGHTCARTTQLHNLELRKVARAEVERVRL